MDEAFVILKSTPIICKRCGVNPAGSPKKTLCQKCFKEAKRRKAELARRRRQW